jgi:hypothetical protein
MKGLAVAQKTVVILEDDIDGGSADETVKFSLDGVSYEIDLNAKNAAKFREAISLYTASARRVGRGTVGRPAGRRGGRAASSRDIRSWAMANGIEVSQRGRIPADVLAAYEKAAR